MPLSTRYKKPSYGSSNQLGKRDTTYRDPRRDSSGSNATITDKHERSGSTLIIMEYTAKYAINVITITVNSDNNWSQDSLQYTNMNDDGMVETGNET